ncbi:hypothetical protein [Peribacillus sp. V2I11]|uniref:hypothetical protein n=1 Tax=Peribacillus sp. V2I11 TaxID=3042277 RepID=UPI00277E2EE6|nr:hypothetical protein [Peribacillus sp. V2I11]MDQ0882722.1 hypothetical protein [Peribacillus sp. V2I11]
MKGRSLFISMQGVQAACNSLIILGWLQARGRLFDHVPNALEIKYQLNYSFLVLFPI